VRADFSRLFTFAYRRGTVQAGDREHFSRRYANDPYGTRRELEMRVAGTISADHGAVAQIKDVHCLPDYPAATLPDDLLAYPTT
jgi:hypothetical protein